MADVALDLLKPVRELLCCALPQATDKGFSTCKYYL